MWKGIWNGKECGKEYGKECGKECGKESGKEFGKEFGKESGKECGQEIKLRFSQEIKLKCGNKNSFVKIPFCTIDLFIRIIFCDNQYFTQRFKTHFQDTGGIEKEI